MAGRAAAVGTGSRRLLLTSDLPCQLPPTTCHLPPVLSLKILPKTQLTVTPHNLSPRMIPGYLDDARASESRVSVYEEAPGLRLARPCSDPHASAWGGLMTLDVSDLDRRCSALVDGQVHQGGARGAARRVRFARRLHRYLRWLLHQAPRRRRARTRGGAGPAPVAGWCQSDNIPLSIWDMIISILSSPTSLSHIPYRCPG